MVEWISNTKSKTGTGLQKNRNVTMAKVKPLFKISDICAVVNPLDVHQLIFCLWPEMNYRNGSYQMDGLLFCQGHASWWYGNAKISKEGLVLWWARVRTPNGQDIVVQIGPAKKLCRVFFSDRLPFAVGLSVLLPLWVKEVVFVDVFNLRLVQHAWGGRYDKSPIDPGEKV